MLFDSIVLITIHCRSVEIIFAFSEDAGYFILLGISDLAFFSAYEMEQCIPLAWNQISRQQFFFD